MTIREARDDDVPALTDIFNDAIARRMSAALHDAVSVAERRAWLHGHDARHPVWVAVDDGGPAGWLSVAAWSEREGYDGTAELSVYVAADRQRRGIGARLLAHALECAPALGFEVLTGCIFAHNTPSLALFERFGFERWGRLPGVVRLDGIPRDVVIVGRRLERVPGQDGTRAPGRA